ALGHDELHGLAQGRLEGRQPVPRRVEDVSDGPENPLGTVGSGHERADALVVALVLVLELAERGAPRLQRGVLLAHALLRFVVEPDLLLDLRDRARLALHAAPRPLDLL